MSATTLELITRIAWIGDVAEIYLWSSNVNLFIFFCDVSTMNLTSPPRLERRFPRPYVPALGLAYRRMRPSLVIRPNS